MGHAALYNEFGGEDWQDRANIFADEEQMIIDRLEKPAVQSIGAGFRSGRNTFSSRQDMINGTQGMRTANMGFKASYYTRSFLPIPFKIFGIW